MNSIYCKRCGNTNPKLFFYKNGKAYCKACIKYSGKHAIISKAIRSKNVKSQISYGLSTKQQNVSTTIINHNGNEIYVDAVCGSGKTEIVFESIENAIKNGQRVGFIIPRREVVIEIYNRLKETYPTLNIIAVYGGHNEFLDGDIVCLTCHQAYRYPNKFGLVILDEYDAFPLKGDNTLLEIVKKTSYGKIIYLSATFSKEFLKDKAKVSLNKRYHHYDIPVPVIKKCNKANILFKLVNFIKTHKDSSLFIFVPTISEAKKLKISLKFFLIKSIVFTSKSEDRKQLLQNIKNRTDKIIICTTILERGITVENVNIVIYKAHDNIFDTSTLIQISGRAGRKSSCPTGEVVYLAFKETPSMLSSIDTIIEKNAGNGL